MEGLARDLRPPDALLQGEARIEQTESSFRWDLNEDAMATEKLAEGIRNFTRDTEKLEAFVQELAATAPRAANA